MQETCNNCFGLKKCSRILCQAKTGKHECRNIIATLLFYFGTRAYLFSPDEDSSWRRVVLHIFDSKQLLRIFCILWRYYSKHYSIILENASLRCFIIILKIGFRLGKWFLSSLIIQNCLNVFKTIKKYPKRIKITFHGIYL